MADSAVNVVGASSAQLRHLSKASHRVDRGRIGIRWCEADDHIYRAFAIPRSVGNAVRRNRIRRQLHHRLLEATRSQLEFAGPNKTFDHTCVILIIVRPPQQITNRQAESNTSTLMGDFDRSLSVVFQELIVPTTRASG